MDIKNRILYGRWEAVTFLVNIICTKIFLNYTRMTIEDAGTAGWIISIYISMVFLIIFTVLIKLYKNFEGKDIIEIADSVGGKIYRIITGLIATLSLFYLTAIIIREFAEDFKVISLPSSPLSFVMFFFIAGMVTASFLGIESIMRYNSIVVPVIIAGYIFILIGIIPEMNLTNLAPVLGTGPGDIFGKGVFRVSVFGELLVLFIIPPFLGNYKNVKSVGYIAIGISSFFLTAGSLAYILVYPYPASLEPFLPIYQMARLINYGRFFQRIESMFVFIWAMAAFLYLTSTFYFSVYTFAETFGLKYLRPLIFPFAILVLCAAFLPSNLTEAIQVETNYGKYAFIISLVSIGAVLTAANLKKRFAGDGLKK